MSEYAPEPVMQVLMVETLFERFKDWLDREVNAQVFRIPIDEEDDLPTYGVQPRRW